MIHLATPTSTLIGRQQVDPFQVLLLQSKQHQGKFVLPSGAVDLAKRKTYEQTVRHNFQENCGNIATLTNLKPFSVAIDPYRDVREVDLTQPQDIGNDLKGFEEALVSAHFGTPDLIFIAEVKGFISRGEEATSCRFYDIRLIQLEDLASGHDVLLLIYQHYLRTGKTIPILDDFNRIRREMASYETT